MNAQVKPKSEETLYSVAMRFWQDLAPDRAGTVRAIVAYIKNDDRLLDIALEKAAEDALGARLSTIRESKVVPLETSVKSARPSNRAPGGPPRRLEAIAARPSDAIPDWGYLSAYRINGIPLPAWKIGDLNTYIAFNRSNSQTYASNVAFARGILNHPKYDGAKRVYECLTMKIVSGLRDEADRRYGK